MTNYQKEYYARPEVRERIRAYYQRPEVRQKLREYNARPEVKEKRRTYVCEGKLVNDFVDRFGKKFISPNEIRILSRVYARNANMVSGMKIRQLQKRILANTKITARIRYIKR
jgi:hypothetical protein